MSEELTHDAFLEQLNSEFRLHLEGRGSIEVELCEVSALKLAPRQETFSIVFRGPTTLMLAQRTYRLERDGMNPFELLLVPIRRDSEGIYYEAVFNRLVESA